MRSLDHKMFPSDFNIVTLKKVFLMHDHWFSDLSLKNCAECDDKIYGISSLLVKYFNKIYRSVTIVESSCMRTPQCC